MNQFLQNVPHMIMALVAVTAVTILSLHGTLSGGEALAVIAGATGFTMGVSGGSQSPTGAVANLPAPSPLSGQTVTETVAHSIATAPTANGDQTTPPPA